MKKEMNATLGRLKNGSVFFVPLMAALIGSVTLDARAAVQATRFNPPLSIGAWVEPPNNVVVPWNILATDFNTDGDVDFRLMYGFGEMSAYFNAPTRFAVRVPHPIPVVSGGPVAGIPLNSTIGSNIVSRGADSFAWSPGYTNSDDLTQPLGDHDATVIIANIAPGFPPGPIISFSTNGTLVTNIYWPGPFATGDVVGREAVMAVQFNVYGETHYGYIHFDFRSGSSGYIYGWAYETEPNVPIKAVPLSNGMPRTHKRVPIVAVPSSQPMLEPADNVD